MSASAVGYRHLEVVQVGLKVLEMGNPALLLREAQGAGLSSLLLLTPSDSADPFGVLVTMVASVARDALDIGLVCP